MSLPASIWIEPLTTPVQAEVTVPGSKSITNRALILAALANGRTVLRGALSRVLSQMVAYTQFDSSFPAGTHHGHGVIQGRGHGFFHQHVLASTRCSERLRGVQGVRRGDEYRLYAWVTQECLQIAIRRFGPMLLGKGLGASLVPAIDGYQIRIWGGVERRGNFDIRM